MERFEQRRQALQRIVGDRMTILCSIGGGGMAQVFLGQHRGHGGLLAIKVLSETLSGDKNIVDRFRLEAKTAALLSGHPNIVPIFDVNEGGGMYYIIMQYIVGEDLNSYLKRIGVLQAADAMNLAAQVAEALDCAAASGIVHRDLKPGNIRLDRYGRAIVLDFGIAKATTVMDGLTRTGETMGTPFYMCPEQIQEMNCDSRSDLYSLGCVLFELMTGRRPYAAFEESYLSVLNAHMHVPVPSVLEIKSDLPPAFANVVSRLMQKDPADRYSNPRDLLNDLHALGVSSGPGELRPQADLATEAIIEEARKHPAAGEAPTIGEWPDSSERLAHTMVREPGTSLDELDPRSHLGQDFMSAPGVAGTPGAAGLAVSSSAPSLAEAPRTTAAPATKTAHQRGWKWARVAAVLLAGIAVFGIIFLNGNELPKVISDANGRMLLVPAGSFVFGDDSPDSPNRRQTLTLPDYYIDEMEVSNAQYRNFCNATMHSFPKSASGEVAIDFTSHPDFPVTDVNLEDARAYAAWAGKRLPTEQEWERAARGTDGRTYPWGDTPWEAGIPQQLQPVEFGPDRKSPVGAFNMAGNAFEWTDSLFPATEKEYADMQQIFGTDASFRPQWNVIKGGAFAPHQEFFFRAYMRRGWPSDKHSPLIGFRCVRSAKPTGLPARMKGWFK